MEDLLVLKRVSKISVMESQVCLDVCDDSSNLDLNDAAGCQKLQLCFNIDGTGECYDYTRGDKDTSRNIHRKDDHIAADFSSCFQGFLDSTSCRLKVFGSPCTVTCIPLKKAFALITVIVVSEHPEKIQARGVDVAFVAFCSRVSRISYVETRVSLW